MKVNKIKDFIERNENMEIQVAKKFTRDECDPLSEVLWEGMLHDIPEEYWELEVIGAGWMMGAKKNRLDVFMGEEQNKMKTDEQIKIERLYKVLEQLEDKGATDEAAALRWAIFKLEQEIKA